MSHVSKCRQRRIFSGKGESNQNPQRQVPGERGYPFQLNQSLPFETLKQKSIINERAKGLDQNPDFSILIRRGLPGMEG